MKLRLHPDGEVPYGIEEFDRCALSVFTIQSLRTRAGPLGKLRVSLAKHVRALARSLNRHRAFSARPKPLLPTLSLPFH